MKRFLNFLDNVTLTQFLCMWFPIILLASVGIGLLVSFIVNEYNECVQLLDMVINDEIKD